MVESLIWTEKYRPKTFSEIAGQNEIVKRVKGMVEKGNLPHILFAGPAGIGKSTLALVVAKSLFGDDIDHNFLEMNASDSRGIDTIRNEVKDFAKTKSLKDVPFKIILLDECDSLTKEAQQALRRTMENYSKTCRFIFSCNFPSKIIDPIVSRCVVFKFKPLKKDDIFGYVNFVVEKEGLKIGDGVLEALFEVSEGDCRRVVNTLQSCASLSKEIKVDDVYHVAGSVKPKEVLEVLKVVISGEFVKGRRKLLEVMLEYGLSGLDIVKQIQREVWGLELEDKEKLRLIERCGEIEFRIVEGSDEFIQLEALLASFIRK